MKKYLITLLLFSTQVFAASGSGNVSNIVELGGSAQFGDGTVLGSMTIPSGSSIAKTLTSFQTSGTGGLFFNLYDMSNATNAQYQVASGKSFNINRVCSFATSTGTYQPGFGTAALASHGTATPPTGAKYYGGAVDRAVLLGQTSKTKCDDISGKFPADSFPFLQVVTGGSLAGAIWTVYGIEQ